VWFPNSQHALLVHPVYKYDSSARTVNLKWSRCKPTALIRGTFELIHEYQDKCYYVGTYRALEGPKEIYYRDVSVRSFVRRGTDSLDTAMAHQTALFAPERNAVAITLPEMYRNGILKIQLVGLQCIGFNRRLDAELHRKSSPPDEALSDSILGADGPIQKRKRASRSSGSDSEGSTETEEPVCKEAKISE